MKGGTSDVSAFRILDFKTLQLANVLKDGGLPVGACMVDLAFIAWMKERFGAAFTEIPKSKRAPGSQFMDEFEKVKKTFNGDLHAFFEVPLEMDAKMDDVYWEGKVQIKG